MDDIKNLEDAKKRIQQLEDGIRQHRDEKGNQRCWLGDQRLYSLLSDGGKVDSSLPKRDEFLRRCAQYYDTRQSPDVPGQVEALTRQIEEMKKALGECAVALVPIILHHKLPGMSPELYRQCELAEEAIRKALGGTIPGHRFIAVDPFGERQDSIEHPWVAVVIEPWIDDLSIRVYGPFDLELEAIDGRPTNSGYTVRLLDPPRR